MNKIYRLVFNKSTGLIQVASELASSAGGSVSSRLVNTIVFSESFALIPFRLRTLTAALVSTLLMSGPLLLGRGIASAANCASTISSSSSACTLSTNSVEITGTGSIVSSSIPIGVSSSSTGLNLGGITVDSGGLLQYTGSTGTSAGISYVYNPTGAPSPRNYAGAINLNGDLTSSQRGIYVNGFVLDSVSIGSGSTLTAGGFGMFLADSSGVTGNVTNNGTISSGSYSISIGGASSGVVASYIEGGITNSGTITSSNGVAINNAGDITGAITNSATGILNGAINISGTATGGIDNFGIINHTNNPDSYAINITGSVGGGITNESSGVINGTVYANTVTALTLDNSGQINGPVTFNATPGTINLNGAAGTITGAVTGSNTTVNAVGTFSTANTFNVKTFNVNAGGSPTITGNYAQSGTSTLEIASTTSYSILNITGGASFSGAYDFTLLPSSTLVADNLYQGILRSNSLAGFTTQTYTQSLGGTSYTYQVLQDATNAGWLDLCYSPIAGSCTGGSGKPDIVVAGNSDGTNIASSIVSGVSPNFNNRFDGGTLLVDVANTYGGNFTITTNGGLINANGLASTFTGVFSDDASGIPGSLSITNSAASNGTVTLTGTNTYTGTTTIDTGATLALSGTGSIATSRGVVDNGSFDISATTSGASITTLSGNGQALLGAQTLTITNGASNGAGSGTFDGVISGTGGVTLTGGTQTLTGTNTYTGATTISGTASANKATLALTGTGSIATSSGVNLTGYANFDISGTTAGATIQSLADVGIENTVFLGAQNLTLSNASGTYSGVIADGSADGSSSATGGSVTVAAGTQTLTGTNTYTGTTTIDTGATLALSGTGSIATSRGVVDNGSFDISATTSGASITTLSGNGQALLGAQTLTITNGASNGAGSGTFDGVISGTGGVTLTGGTQTLTGTNTYTGATTINPAATLALSGNGSITTSSTVNNTGKFDVTAKTGNVALGGTYTQTSSGTLLMTISPNNNQQVNVAGAVTVAGTLNLAASGGTYRVGRYTLMTGNGVSGTFGTFSSNLSSVTPLRYSLAYDPNDVYLVLGPATADSQQSLVNTANALQPIFTLQNTVLANSFTYDCPVFDIHNICVSAGGRNTAVQASNGLNNTSGLLIAAYRLDDNTRIGAYADQNLSVANAPSGVKLGNNSPLIGVFGVWAEDVANGTGWEAKVAAAYGKKNATVTRQVVGSSEPGSGGSALISQGAQIIGKYGFGVTDNTVVSPYLGMRYTQNNMGGYTEQSTASVYAPMTFGAVNTNATTALAGVGASYKGIPATTFFASAGIESDTKTSNGSYLGTNPDLGTLTTINFNPNPVKTRPTATVGAYYDVEKNQRIGVTGIYRQEPFKSVSTTTAMVTYTVGF